MQVQTRTQTVAEDGIQGTQQWSLFQCVCFRFAFMYLGLYNFTAILGWVPYSDYVFGKVKEFWHVVVPWVGKYILHLSYDITVFPNGSGDTTYNYVHVLCFVVLAIVGTTIWSLLDNKRQQYERLHEWLRLYVRIALASMLIGYGFSKFQQFPAPTISTLLEPFGQSSPMNLLWTFMGASRAYCAFAGVAELLAGVLLLIPNLTTIGALFGTAVMSNVFMLNMCYDVPVKLFSFHLLLMCVFLLVPEFNRLANVFLFNKAVAPTPTVLFFNNKVFNRVMVAFQILFCCYLLYMGISYHNKAATQEAEDKPLFDGGIWLVDDFSVDGQVRQPLLTDNDRWQRICFPYPEMLSVQYANGKTLDYVLNYDKAHKIFDIESCSEQTASDADQLPVNAKKHSIGSLTIRQMRSDSLVVDGTLAGKQIHTTLRHLKNPQFLLLNRGFHWIQEHPLNR